MFGNASGYRRLPKMTKTQDCSLNLTTKSQSTDGVWAGRLQNRWFLAERDACASKLGVESQWLREMR
jgi:hypothetical protein